MSSKAEQLKPQHITAKKKGSAPAPLIFLASVFVVVLALELFLHLAGVGEQEFLKPDPVLGCRHLAGKRVVWHLEGYSSDRMSSAGLRDVEHNLAKPAGVTRIALLGDSTTEGLQVPLADTYARRLEKILNESGKGKFEVLNFACSSFSTGQEYLQFQNEVAAYRPDLAVVLFNRGDDKENIRDMAGHETEPRPYFYIDANGNLCQDASVLNSQYAGMPKGEIIDFLRRNSCIFGILNQINLNMSISDPLYRKLTGTFKKIQGLAQGKSHAAYALYPQPNAYTVTEKLFEQLNIACNKDKCKLVVMMFPNTLSDLGLGFESNQLERLSKSQHFGFLDLTQAFTKNKNTNSFFLQYHFSAKGHDLVARELANYLKASGAVQ